ncbi:MAG: glycosyl hydrolase-related protein [Christensenellales bacterium]|jgi:mannosylglycerate hydrolase
MTKRVFVVSHTHWDREWYFSKSTFQMMNADMMAHLLDILANNPSFTSFMLDGQLIALEDYLEIHPDQVETIRSLVSAGRLVIGPWYVLPDEYLASGEAHIRNYMEGMRLAEGFGGGARIGYLPDSFGHPAQMPQIISGLGMKEMIFWRGTGPSIRHTEFIWAGKDGSTILALNMLYGYSNAANLKEDKAVRFKRLDHEIGKLMDVSQLNMALLMNGTDHIAPDSRVPEWIEEYQQERPDIRITHGSMMAFVQEAHARAQAVNLQLVQGELRSGYRAYLLGDTLSTRMPLKQCQRQVETQLENHLEPLFTLLDIQNQLPYPQEKFRHLWRLTLQNLPHDSICGCGCDAIHREMMLRYSQMQDIVRHLLDTAQASLSGGMINTEADGELAVFSPFLSQQHMPVHATLQKVLHPLRHVDYEQDQKLLEYEGNAAFDTPSGILLTDEAGRSIRGIVEEAFLEDTIESHLMTQPLMNRVASFRCVFSDALPPLAIKKYRYQFLYEQPMAPPRQLENEFLILKAAADGTLSMYHKEASRWYHGLCSLLDVADVGDEYTFDGLPGDRGISMDPDTVAIAYSQHAVTIRGVLNLPVACAENRRARSNELIACAVTITARLLPGVDRVDISVTMDNKARDHRLTALFPLGAQADGILCDTLFAVEQLPIIRQQNARQYEGWMEQPNNSFFVKNFAALTAPQHSLAVFVKGLPQCEAVPGDSNDQLKLTLMRCVGWLSRKDLLSRDGNGGWSIPTPEAQLIGSHAFKFALFPFVRQEMHELYARALAFSAGAQALQTSREGASAFAPSVSLFETNDQRLVLSALKKAEDGAGYIIRLVNMSGDVVNACLSLHRRADAWHTNLAEENQAPIGKNLTCLPVKAKPWQVVTYRLMYR